jgi:hypothetical protein
MKCPKCEKPLTSATVKAITGSGEGKKFALVAYSCPLCQSVVSIQMDPLALNIDLRNDLKKQ